jgi:DNA-binding CsgD family transcriptional regulator
VDGDVALLGAVELTEKEREVLALLPHRPPRRESAAQLYMSENTLKTHLTSIRHKLALERKDDIEVAARVLGLIPLLAPEAPPSSESASPTRSPAPQVPL